MKDMRKYLVTTLAAAVLLLAVLAGAALAGPVLERIIKNETLVVGTDPTFPPLEAKAKDGTLIGFDIDLAGLMAEAMGVRLVIKTVPFGDLPKALVAGKIDMILSGMTITARRNLKMVFVGPYLLAGQTLLMSTGTARKVMSAEDLNKPEFTVAAAQHTTAVAAIKEMMPQAKLITAQGEQKALKLLLEGKAHALVTDLPFNAVMAFRHREDGLVHIDTPFTFEPLGIAIAPGDADLLNWLNNFLTLLRGSGQLDMLGDKWFRDPSWIDRLK